VNYSLLDNTKSGTGGEASATEEEYESALKLLHLSDSYVNQLPDK
jgi:hypothetical protein